MSYVSLCLKSLGGFINITTEVGLLVPAFSPNASLDGTNMYGILFFSQQTGIWDITSTGLTSPAIIHNPFSFFWKLY